jgi:hypothetical protein
MAPPGYWHCSTKGWLRENDPEVFAYWFPGEGRAANLATALPQRRQTNASTAYARWHTENATGKC